MPKEIPDGHVRVQDHFDAEIQDKPAFEKTRRQVEGWIDSARKGEGPLLEVAGN